MRVTVERLRLWILLLAGVVIVILVGFFLWSGFQYRRIVQNLPRRLGVNIQQTASGFTYSQSSHGHTLFTIHASKLMSFKNDRAELHDVSITLYGPPGSRRTDKIYGSEFEFDRKTGIASSQGKVEIDLENPSQSEPANAAQQSIHVQTSQLTYNSKTGLAQTSQYTEFSLPQGSGHATGATYNSKTGLLVLEQQVYLQTQPTAAQTGSAQAGSGAVIRAAHLSFLRNSNEATLLTPEIQYHNATTTAAQALLYFRSDGSADHVIAQGDVRVRSVTGAVFTAQLAQIHLGQNNQPQTATLSGGITYAGRAPHQSMHGSAQQAQLFFAPQPNHPSHSLLRHAQFSQNVHFVEQLTGVAGDAKAVSTRNVQGGSADVVFVPVQGGTKSAPSVITVEQNAVAVLHTVYTHQPSQQSTIRADKLVASLADGRVLRTVDGTGHAELVSTGKDGAVNTTHSDTLHLVFAPPRKASAAQLVSAVENGHVVMHQIPGANTPARKSGSTKQSSSGAQQPITAWADQANYTASDETVRLSGHPRLQQAGSLELSANAIDYHRDSGNALATGNVQATYRQPVGAAHPASAEAVPQLGGKGATHVVAARAAFFAAKDQATFYGVQGRPARLWQGGDSVSAPVIALRRNPQELRAYGSVSGSGSDTVHAAFAAVMGKKAPPGLVRVVSDSLVYSGKSHQGDFRGHVQAVDAFGSMQAANINMRIAPAEKHQPARLEEMVATGGVILTQPGRQAAGTRLVYTANDERYVLTGRPGALPYLVDRVHGRTTGAALIFNNRNDSVEVNGGKGSAVTETHIPR